MRSTPTSNESCGFANSTSTASLFLSDFVRSFVVGEAGTPQILFLIQDISASIDCSRSLMTWLHVSDNLLCSGPQSAFLISTSRTTLAGETTERMFLAQQGSRAISSKTAGIFATYSAGTHSNQEETSTRDDALRQN